jgi:hypothetical protein
MITEKDTIKCESVFNDERTHRYLVKRVWNKDKPCIAVIMLAPCLSDNIVSDTTTNLVINNVARMEEYGGVHILNLYSMLTNKLCFRFNSDEDLSHVENDDYIVKSARECSKVILAWGKTENTNQRIAERAAKVIELLQPVADKLCQISDGTRSGLHPLTPSIRSHWELVKFETEKPS